MVRMLYQIPVLILTFSLLAAGQPPKAETERRGAIAYNQGSEAFSAGDYTRSIPLLLAADSLIGESEQVDRLKLRFTIGLAYLKSSQPSRALEFFEWVAGQDSSYPYIHLQLAAGARQAGQPAKALEHYRAGLAGAPEAQKPVILAHIADLLEKRRDLQGALKAYDQAILLNQAAEYHFRRGLLYNRLADPLDHAEDETYDFEEAVTSGLLTEEILLKATGLREKALADFRRAAEDGKLAERAARMVERTEILIRNNQTVISEIHYLRENK
ncbi:MAG: hypothetical protein JXQ83_15595 [Candidatus Glassbacteria bacterium]|nr:hypothetical protein [Candidatus Glassbacteria bacterium]